MAGLPIRGLQRPLNVLVSGASSGIGLAVCDILLQNPNVAHLAALSRSAEQSPALTALEQHHGARLQRLSLDLSDEAAVNALAVRLDTPGNRLHLVFNAAGVLHGADFGPEKSLAQVSLHALQQVFAVNAFAPILLARAVAPLLRHGEPAVFASLSARVGSIVDNRLGGWYAYRASKAAQNQLLRTLAIELRRINRHAACVALHPGTVDTALSSPFSANVPADKLFSPAQSAHKLLALIAGLGPEDSGRFIAWDGSDIPW